MIRQLQKRRNRVFCPAPFQKGKPIGSYSNRRERIGAHLPFAHLAASSGSVTVEAALAFPLFLCAVCGIIGMGQMMMVQTEVQYSVSQTAKICAKKATGEMVSDAVQQEGQMQQKENKSLSLSDYGNVRLTFLSVYDGGSLCESVIWGGKSGIRVSLSSSGKEEITVRANYVLRMPVPFFKKLRFSGNTAVTRRIFSGYVEHEGESSDKAGNRLVYVAENGSVYHTNPECSHICLKISGDSAVKKIVSGSAYDACEKCIHNGNIPDQLYITANGDCYHSSLSCSGLKRTIRTVRLDELSGMRLCSRCAKAKQ